MTKKAKSPEAFTLMELLVVIAIIALLMSIMMPALSRAKDIARQVMCASNLKQSGYVIAMYATENKDRIPEGRAGTAYWMDIYKAQGMNETQAWQEAVKVCVWQWVCEPYYEQLDFLLCPATKKPDLSASTRGARDLPWVETQTLLPSGQPFASSYGSNGWVELQGVDRKTGAVENNWFYPRCYKGRFSVKFADQVPLIMDAALYEIAPFAGAEPHIRPIMTPQDAETPDYNTDCLNPAMLDRHLGRTQMVFMDGAVNKIGLLRLWQLRWHNEWNKADVVLFADPDFTGWNRKEFQWIKKLPK